MYKLSPEIVRPGCSLQALIQHRKDTGLFSGDVAAYCREILDMVRTGTSKGFYVQASDGRMVLAKNEPLPDGGWVSTHEDVTEQRRAEQERAAVRDQEQRRAAIDRAIGAFRPQAEALLATVSDSAGAMSSTAGILFGASDQTSTRANGAVEAYNEDLHQCGKRRRRRRRTGALDRRDQPPAHLHQGHRRRRRPKRRAPPTARSAAWPPARVRSATWSC